MVWRWARKYGQGIKNQVNVQVPEAAFPLTAKANQSPQTPTLKKAMTLPCLLAAAKTSLVSKANSPFPINCANDTKKHSFIISFIQKVKWLRSPQCATVSSAKKRCIHELK